MFITDKRNHTKYNGRGSLWVDAYENTVRYTALYDLSEDCS